MWIKSKRFLLSSGLFLLLSLAPSSSYSYAEVVLTDAEAQELMNEIQESKKDLTELKNQLNEAETQLTDVKNTYEEQKTSYEKQLEEAKKDKEKLKIATSVSGGSALTLLIVTVLLIIF